MAFCRLVLPLVLSLICLQSATSSQVPVFLWGDLATTSIKANPLSKVSLQEFDALLKQELKDDPFTVVFIEETLSVEDLSEKNDDGESSFPFLQANIANSVYLPSVETAVKALNKLAEPEKVDHVKLTENGLSAEIKPESGRFLFITLKDAKDGESRAELLRRHNNFMEDMCGKLQEHNKQVVAIYTAHNPSWTIPEHSRVRRQASANVTSSNSILKLDNLLLYVNQLVLTIGNTTQNLESPSSQTTNLNGTDLVADLVYGDKTVKLFFNENAYGYWFFNKVELTAGTDTEELEPLGEGPVYALKGFAYRCAQDVSFASVNTTREYTLRFNDIKVEAFSNGTAFSGDSFNCVGFFSAPIWSALFVVFILLAITFYGIIMMMDIRTMDRFDDPKGKTITINASE